MEYRFHEILDPFREKVKAFEKLNESERLTEMIAVLQGCGFTSEEVHLIKDSVKLSARILDFERFSS